MELKTREKENNMQSPFVFRKNMELRCDNRGKELSQGAYLKLEKKEVTLELAEQALKDIISPDEKKVITPEYIISVVAEHYGVTPADLSGNKRNSKIVMPRQVSMYLCREIISTPLKNIGKALDTAGTFRKGRKYILSLPHESIHIIITKKRIIQ